MKSLRREQHVPALFAMVAGALSAALMSCWVSAAELASGPIAPLLPGRPIASRVGEPSALRQLQDRLDLQDRADGGADCNAQYQSHKAQAWLNFARYAIQNDVPAPVQAAALRNASTPLDSLQRHDVAPVQTEELPQSRHVRDDLWRSVKAVRGDGRWCAAPRMTAYCEVQLAWSDYEAGAGGWRHVEPYIRIAEDYCVAASRAVAPPAAAETADAVPASPAAAPTAALSAAPPVVAEPTQARSADPTRSPVEAPIVVRFPHDRSKRSEIRVPGRQILQCFAEHFLTLPANATVDVVGHADITGHSAYNLALSDRRARSVALELKQWGVDPARIHVVAVGDSRPEVSCRLNSRSRRAKRRYIACLEPNRRVVVQLQGDTR
jgi:outer membrane protein OmpA-like peptidoglycan-associated protein